MNDYTEYKQVQELLQMDKLTQKHTMLTPESKTIDEKRSKATNCVHFAFCIWHVRKRVRFINSQNFRKLTLAIAKKCIGMRNIFSLFGFGLLPYICTHPPLEQRTGLGDRCRTMNLKTEQFGMVRPNIHKHASEHILIHRHTMCMVCGARVYLYISIFLPFFFSFIFIFQLLLFFFFFILFYHMWQAYCKRPTYFILWVKKDTNLFCE